MRHFTTLLTMAITFTGLGQQMPYNPDANGDDFVGVDDVLGVLGVYDTALMQPDLQCDYEGTELESIVVGAITGEIIIDSVYVEYLLLDTLTYFTPGCPDLVVEPIVLERSYMLDDIVETDNAYRVQGNLYGYQRYFKIFYQENTNEFLVQVFDSEIGLLPTFSSDANWLNYYNALPFPPGWYIDENGIQVPWRVHEWTAQAQALRIIPFWHEAE